MTESIHATTTREVADLASRVASSPSVALDTEFLWEKTYRPQLCLVQVAIADVEATIDPLGGADLAPLWEALVGGPLVVVHAGAHDLDILHRASGSLPVRVADSQVAGAFLGYGEAIGYGNLVSAVLRRQVRGGEGYTDWSRRPLSAQQQEYALEDVRHLLGLWDALAADLDRRGRTAWAAEETARRFVSIGDDPEPSEAWRRVTDARKLKGRSLAVLREVTAWREREAMHKDLARQRLVPDRVLIEVARRGPTEPGQIGELRGLHPGQVKVLAGPLIDAVRRAGTIPEADWPRWDPPRPHAGDPRVDAIASLLHAVVRSRAREMDLASGLLGSRSDLEESVRLLLAGGLDDADVPLLRGWRRTAVGEEVLRVLGGEVAVRVGQGPNGVQLEVG